MPVCVRMCVCVCVCVILIIFRSSACDLVFGLDS